MENKLTKIFKIEELKINSVEKIRLKIAMKEKQALEAWSSEYLLCFFQKQGLWLNKNEGYTLRDVQEKLGVVEKYHRLLESLIKILKDKGWLIYKSEIIISTEKITEKKVDARLKELEEKRKSVGNSKYLETWYVLIIKCISQYAEILSGKVRAREVLFPNENFDFVATIYSDGEIVKKLNEMVSQVVGIYIKRKNKGKIKILEIGAGTGGTTGIVLKNILEYGNHFEYAYTDVSANFFPRAKNKFSQYQFIKYDILDIEKSVTKQGYKLADWDIIIATNALHATKNMLKTLTNVKSLLRERGWLIVNEHTKFTVYPEVTFGLLNGWWLSEDQGLRINGTPFLDKENWKMVCNAAGFSDIMLLDEEVFDVDFGENIIVAV